MPRRPSVSSPSRARRSMRGAGPRPPRTARGGGLPGRGGGQDPFSRSDRCDSVATGSASWRDQFERGAEPTFAAAGEAAAQGSSGQPAARSRRRWRRGRRGPPLPPTDGFAARGILRALAVRRNLYGPIPYWRRQESDRDTGGCQHALGTPRLRLKASPGLRFRRETPSSSGQRRYALRASGQTSPPEAAKEDSAPRLRAWALFSSHTLMAGVVVTNATPLKGVCRICRSPTTLRDKRDNV
jgi:hypothetical protein